MHLRIGVLRSGDFVNSTLYIAMLVGLAIVLIARFPFGCYWLATKDRLPSPSVEIHAAAIGDGGAAFHEGGPFG